MYYKKLKQNKEAKKLNRAYLIVDTLLIITCLVVLFYQYG